MKVTLAYAERQLRHWTKKVAELRLTSNAFDASNTEKENEEKRDIPPKPPIESKEEKEKEETTTTTARAESFKKPSVEDIAAYCREKGYGINAEHFWNYYEAKGWMVGRHPMKNWRAAIVTWVRKDSSTRTSHQPSAPADAFGFSSGRTPPHADNYLPPSESLVKRMMNLSEKAKSEK